VAIAREFGGEIVSADAFAVYRGFDIGTAKPSRELRHEIPHHLIDVADPAESYSAGRWAGAAREAIASIDARGRIPVVTGGSHFYVRALLAGLPGDEVVSPELRRYFRGAWTDALRRSRKRMIDVLDPGYGAGVSLGDTARIARALEILLSTGRRVSERRLAPGIESRPLLKLALQFTREGIYTRLEERVSAMWQCGWPREVEQLLAAGVPDTAPAFRAIGYRELAERAAGRLSDADAFSLIVSRTRALAKRQSTWLASEPGLDSSSRGGGAPRGGFPRRSNVNKLPVNVQDFFALRYEEIPIEVRWSPASRGSAVLRRFGCPSR
jgi:tRNA dimethylallyltransferase